MEKVSPWKYISLLMHFVKVELLQSQSWLPNNFVYTFTQLRLWVLTLGFTLSFGVLFAKTWQVYRVYTNSDLKKKVCLPSVLTSSINTYSQYTTVRVCRMYLYFITVVCDYFH